MKKIFILIISLCLLSGCTTDSTAVSGSDDRYYDMLHQLENVQNYASEPTYYSLTIELSEVEGGYRFFVIVDEPKIAMYNIQVMAIVEGDDYSNTMAANVGIFEDTSYTMIPHQTKPDDGYVAGLSISGLTEDNPCTLNIMVRYETSDHESVTRDYYRVEVQYPGDGQ